MKKKSIRIIPFIIFGIALFSVWYWFEDQKITVIPSFSQAWVIPYSNAQELLMSSNLDLVIEAKVSANSNPLIIKDEHTGLVLKRMLTEVDVQTVIQKNNSLPDIPKKLNIIEPTYVVRQDGVTPGWLEQPVELYRKAVPDATYLLFLFWSEKQGQYWVNAVHQGKFNLDGKDKREVELAKQNEGYRQLKASVLEHFTPRISNPNSTIK